MSLERFARKEMVIARPDETVAQVATRMTEHHVGAVVVVDERRPIGIVTDRDLVTRVLALRGSIDDEICEVMTPEPATLRWDATLDMAISRMKEEGVRRLPLVDAEGRLIGMVTFDDLAVLLAAEEAALANAVRENRGP